MSRYPGRLAMRLLLLVSSVVPLAVVLGVVRSEAEQNLDQFKYCIRQSKHPSLRECIGRTALTMLQSIEEKDNFTLAQGFVAARDDSVAARSLVNFLDTDPVDFRGILENAGAVFSQRSLEFHMDSLYPGLMLKIGPSADAKSLAEFVLDPAVAERGFGFDEPSTARVLAKQYLVPFLLGLKFNLVALVPLLFAGICLLLKKSLFLAKLAIYVSSLLGVGGALTAGGGLGVLGGLGGFGGGFPGAHAHVHGHPLSPGGGGGGGYFPGKTTVYNHYDEDEFHHNSSPYKRTDRKINYEKPREFVSRPVPATPTGPSVDRFYDYEKQVTMQDRSGKLRAAPSGKLGPSAYDEEDDEPYKFMASDRLGWKVVEVK